MSNKYKKCPHCGAHLDHGEHCDCEDSTKEQDKPHRHVKCIDCGLEWNVSRLAEIPWFGYRCPKCTERNRKNGYSR